MGVSKVEGNLTLETSALISETFDSVKYRVRFVTTAILEKAIAYTALS
jgi:hypothetical protein